MYVVFLCLFCLSYDRRADNVNRKVITVHYWTIFCANEGKVKRGMGAECKQHIEDNALLSLLPQNCEYSWSFPTLNGNWDDHVAKEANAARESYCPIMSCSGVVTSSTPVARHRGQCAVWPKFHLMRPNKGALDRVSVRPLSKEHERGLKTGLSGWRGWCDLFADYNEWEGRVVRKTMLTVCMH